MRLFLCSIFLFSISLSGVAGLVYKVNTVPKSKIRHKRYVTDPEHFLNDTTLISINNRLAKLEDLTTDQIAVVVLPSIGNIALKNFAKDLFVRLKVGQKDKNNGLLILLVMDLKRVEFETGYGLETVLPDSVCKRIEMEHMVPYFTTNNYDLGVIEGVSVTSEILSSPTFRNKFLAEEAKEASWDTLQMAQIIVWAIALPYLVFITIVFYVKRNKGSFEETFHRVSRKKQNKIVLRIPTWRWMLIYILIPLSFYLYVNYCMKTYPLTTLVLGLYLILLIMFVDRKSRSIEAYKSSYKEGDYYAKYHSHIKYFDNWGIAAIFFPIPFLFTDWKNKLRLQKIRKHERNCVRCGTTMLCLDEKNEDEFLSKYQQLEEQIKSIDYDVWICSSCNHYEALAYYTKDSKYTACSNCGTKAYYLKSDIEKTPATYFYVGKGEKHFECVYCKREKIEEYEIPRLAHSS